jgi:hypothetical protein
MPCWRPLLSDCHKAAIHAAWYANPKWSCAPASEASCCCDYGSSWGSITCGIAAGRGSSFAAWLVVLLACGGGLLVGDVCWLRARAKGRYSRASWWRAFSFRAFSFNRQLPALRMRLFERQVEMTATA